MSPSSLLASMDFGADVAMGASGAAIYARTAARFTEERNRLQLSGGRPAQIRALGAMADLFHTLAEARRAREEADRRLAEEPLETLEDILAAHRGATITNPRPPTHESA
jgi:hypothetical protein